MATIRKRGKTWRAEVYRKGERRSGSFRTKQEAILWAQQVESDILSGKAGVVPDKPFSALLQRYAREVSPSKRGERWEGFRLDAVARDPIGEVSLRDLSAPHFAAWRDRRKRQVTEGTVLREWTLLNHVCNVAVKEWHWLVENPMKEVKRPKEPEPRTRRPTQDEIERILLTTGYEYDSPPETAMARVGAAFLFAIETAMRQGEICAVTPSDVDLEARTLHIPKTKTGTARTVPLSTEAVRLLRQVDCDFQLSPAILSALFRKAVKRTMIEDLHFHDTRREALTRLAKKLDVMELAKVSGHKDLRILQNVYYAPKPEDLAKKLD